MATFSGRLEWSRDAIYCRGPHSAKCSLTLIPVVTDAADLHGLGSPLLSLLGIGSATIGLIRGAYIL